MNTLKQRLADSVNRGNNLHLPERVRNRIQQQQESSEILIGWIQLGVVLVFASLYTLAPKTFTEEADFAPVPWALSAYFLFTVARLYLAHARRLPDWFLYLSVVLDIGLLLGLIWSFHLQYEQPASFYLKAPTLLYVFIFIALRTLHFEVRFVVLAGVVAALGWLALVIYVIRIEPTDPMITRDYVEYMTSNSVLLGAEFDKIISILTVTAILAVAIARARRLLVQAVVEQSAARDLSRFVPAQVAERVTRGDTRVEAGQGEVREATVLFMDLEGFTGISESLSPQDLIRTLNEYFDVVVEPIAQQGGVVNQFQGDGILASFNLPEANEGHAANAVRAGLAILAALRRHSFGGGISLKARVGISTGVVVGGIVGAGGLLSYTVHGDHVNLAARLEQLNKALDTRILISERTRELAGSDGFAFELVSEVTVRGRSQPARVYTIRQ
jgi:adenylate cyclase